MTPPPGARTVEPTLTLTLLDPGGFRHFGVFLLIAAEPEMPRHLNFVTVNVYPFYTSHAYVEPIAVTYWHQHDFVETRHEATFLKTYE